MTFKLVRQVKDAMPSILDSCVNSTLGMVCTHEHRNPRFPRPRCTGHRKLLVLSGPYAAFYLNNGIVILFIRPVYLL